MKKMLKILSCFESGDRSLGQTPALRKKLQILSRFRGDVNPSVRPKGSRAWGSLRKKLHTPSRFLEEKEVVRS